MKIHENHISRQEYYRHYFSIFVNGLQTREQAEIVTSANYRISNNFILC
jgi:hypothetical protein